MKKVIYGLIFLLPILGRAEVQKILDITSESDPATLSIISIDMGSLHDINNLVYQPDSKETDLKKIPLKKLLKETETVKSEKGVQVVGLMLTQINSTSYIVTLHYLYEFKLLKKTYKDKQLHATFSAPDNRYLMQDPATKKVINRLHFISHYNNKGKEVGIERIETL
jgi:hypothetical protein